MTTDKYSEIITKLEEIINYDFFEGRDLMSAGAPLFGHERAWRQKNKPTLIKINELLSKYRGYLEDSYISKSESKIAKIIQYYEELKLEPNTDFRDKIQKIGLEIDDLDTKNVYLKSFSSVPSDNDISIIISFIADYFFKNSIVFDKSYYISNIQGINVDSFRIGALNNVIEYYNSSVSGRPIGLYLNNADGIISNFNKIKTQQDINITKIAIESAKNEDLVKAFKERADGLRIYIILLNGLIFALFIAMICAVFENYYNFSQSKDLLRTIPLVIVLTAFIAFLTKEKNVLSAQYHNNIKCHTELSALSTYVIGLDKEKVENLKINLAEKYFTGNSDNINVNQEGLNNENYNQIISLIKEIPKK